MVPLCKSTGVRRTLILLKNIQAREDHLTLFDIKLNSLIFTFSLYNVYHIKD